MEKYGVGCFILLLISFIIAFISTGGQCNQNKPGSAENEANGAVFASVGKVNAYTGEVDTVVKQQRDQARGNFGPTEEAQAYAGSIDNVMNHVYGLAFSASKGIDMDDKAVEEAIPTLWIQQEENHRQILIQNHQLSPDANQQQFEAAFQKSSGHSLDAEKQNYIQAFNEAFADPGRKELIRSEVANTVMTATYVAQTKLTDDDLKSFYSTLSVQRIEIAPKNGSNPQQTAEQALSAVKGGMSFEDAITKFNTGPAMAGKKPTDPYDLQGQFLIYQPELLPLLKLQPGQISDPIQEQNGDVAIYKVVSIKQNLPPDFNTKKEQYRSEMQKQLAASKMQADVDAFKKSNPITWKSDAYKAMYDYQQALQNYTATPDQRIAAFKTVMDEAKAARTGGDSHVASLAYFAAETSIYNSATPDKKKSMLADRIDAINGVLTGSPNAALRLEEVDLYLGSGDTKNAVEALKDAAKENGADTGVDGEKNYEAILAKLDKMQSAKQISAEDAKTVQNSLDSWMSTVQEENNMRLQTQKQEEDLRKQNEAIMKKQQAEAAAAAAKTKANGSAKPSVPPSAAATTGK